MSGSRALRSLLGCGILVGALLAGAGCGDDSPTSPAPSGPNVVRIDDPGGLLLEHATAIRTIADTTLARSALQLPITGVTITITADAGNAIDGYGIGGRTPDAATVLIFIDPSFPGLGSLLPDRLPGMIAHELHHAIRWRNPGYGRTLLEAMVSEGLADRFAVELLGVPPPPWCSSLTLEEEAAMLALARPKFDDANYVHADWFFGADPAIPRWTGYTLGYRFVIDYQSAHPGSTAATLVTTRAAEFRPAVTSPGGRP